MEKRPGDDDRWLVWYLRYLYLGFELMLSVAVPTGVGMWLDRRWGTKLLFTLLGLVLGFTAGIYLIYGALFGRNGGGSGRGPRGGQG